MCFQVFFAAVKLFAHTAGMMVEQDSSWHAPARDRGVLRTWFTTLRMVS